MEREKFVSPSDVGGLESSGFPPGVDDNYGGGDPLVSLRGKGGMYRWVYEAPMLKSFFLLLEVWKALGISALILFGIISVIGLVTGSGLTGIISSAGICLMVFGILLVLSIPAYYIVTRANNGKYTVLFEMDETGIDHTQIKTDKAKALELLTAFVGGITGSKTTSAAALLSAGGTSLYSRFDKVRSIRAIPEKDLILLGGGFVRNQIYAEQRYFDAVYAYIRDHCPNAMVR